MWQRRQHRPKVTFNRGFFLRDTRAAALRNGPLHAPPAPALTGIDRWRKNGRSSPQSLAVPLFASREAWGTYGPNLHRPHHEKQGKIRQPPATSNAAAGRGNKPAVENQTYHCPADNNGPR